ncbi:MAG: hypothetical protein K8R21_06440, partial [Leptospira sp.]|nr:hypothetical protein [Leptospira sp.]
DFRNYLNGSIGEKQAEKPRYAEFKGIVFGVTSTDVVVSTARPDKAHSGDVMKFLNRSGKEVAIGIVKEVFHTKVNVALKQGKVDKGFTSVIYGDD